MAVGTFSVGRDVQAVLIGPNGARFDFTNLTGFDWTPQYKDVRSEPLNGPPIERNLPTGHRLKFMIDRNGPTNDVIFTNIEALWWAVGSSDPGTSANGSAFVYINESDGSQTIMIFGGLSVKLTEGGNFTVDNPVKQTIEAHAQRKLQ